MASARSPAASPASTVGRPGLSSCGVIGTSGSCSSAGDRVAEAKHGGLHPRDAWPRSPATRRGFTDAIWSIDPVRGRRAPARSATTAWAVRHWADSAAPTRASSPRGWRPPTACPRVGDATLTLTPGERLERTATTQLPAGLRPGGRGPAARNDRRGASSAAGGGSLVVEPTAARAAPVDVGEDGAARCARGRGWSTSTAPPGLSRLRRGAATTTACGRVPHGDARHRLFARLVEHRDWRGVRAAGPRHRRTPQASFGNSAGGGHSRRVDSRGRPRLPTRTDRLRCLPEMRQSGLLGGRRRRLIKLFEDGGDHEDGLALHDDAGGASGNSVIGRHRSGANLLRTRYDRAGARPREISMTWPSKRPSRVDAPSTAVLEKVIA